MADPFIALGLNSFSYGIDNYERAWHPVKRQVKKVPIHRRSKSKGAEETSRHEIEEMTPEERGWVLKPRREVASDEEIVQYVGKRNGAKGNELVPRRPGGAMVRKTSSVDNTGSSSYRGTNGRMSTHPRPFALGHHSDGFAGAAAQYDDSSDEDTYARSRRGRSQVGKSQQSRGKSQDDESTSSLCSSSEDERNCKKMRRKKWLTAGLATVATIHAAQKVYTSLENRDKRAIAVAEGKTSPEEARKQQNQARWQDAAAIGIAALGIKGAYTEWHEMAEQRAEYKKQEEEREERHRKRAERAKRAKERGLDYHDALHPHHRNKDGYKSEQGSGRGSDNNRRNNSR